ncbi:MAG TPA: ABC transporter substrate-binding protein [Candidatus Dormibacteraeota bacterium]|jgi:ABC-type branched-subunit amino acid transport system substrate-binding protein|nr:ABC transporter substrate-binding protein [Candidatus Dormibacteraeota bacterium]
MPLSRDKLFTLMLMVTVLLTLLFAGLVAADLENGHRTVATALTGPSTGDTATATPGAADSQQPGATAAPGAQGTPVSHAGAAAARGGSNPGVQGAAGAVQNQGVAGGVIRIGDITTQTGPGRSIAMAHAVTAWTRSVNAHGGINGWKINLDLRDDAGNPDQGGAYYHDFGGGANAVFAMVAECAPPTDEQQAGYINQVHLIMVGECQAPPDMYTSPYMWLTGPNPYENGQLGAKLMVALQHWPLGGGQVALVCLNDPSTQKVCDGAADLYGKDRLWHGAPQEEAITDNNYQTLITQWCSASPPVTSVHLVIEPGSTQRYLYAAANQSCNGKPWTPPTFQNLVIDDGVAHYANAAGMMIGTPWTPLDQTGTPGMQRLTTTLQTYYPDDKVDLYAQTSWSYCLLFEHAVQLMGSNVTKQNLIDTLNAIHNWDNGLGAVENYSPTQHDGDVKNWLMQLKNPGDNWQLVSAGGPIRLH